MSSSRFLFVSDLHLDASAPDAIAQFKRFLEGPAAQADALYILGDLFEYWVGDDDDEPARARVCEALKQFAARTPCYVMRGNRDFLFGPAFERRTGCVLLPDPLLLQTDTLRVLVSHGDPLCTDDHVYQEFRSIVRSDDWQRRFLQLPLSVRSAMADAARSGSKAHTTRANVQILDVNEAAVIAAFRLAGCALMIHGHTHRPAVHTHFVDGREATRIVLGDWYRNGSCLLLHGDGRHEVLPLD
jgi:UDP-2,3-diacylglucosamine hydrolase